MIARNVIIKPRRNTTAGWSVASPLRDGELGVNTETGAIKIGDGVTAFDLLPSPSASDHGVLAGLSDDDHVQYHTDARGDARYYTQAQVDSSLAGKADASHSHVIGDVASLQSSLDAKLEDAPSDGSTYGRNNGAWSVVSGGGTSDHGALTGLGDDDHAQYLLVDGTRAMAGSLNLGANNLVTSGTVDGRDVSADGVKLDGIEAGATADQTGAEIKALYEAEADTNAYTDAEKSKLAGIAAGATNNTGALADLNTVGTAEISDEAVTNAKLAHVATSTLKGRITAATGNVEDLTAAQVRTVLNVEDGATADQTGAEIKAAYEAEANTNAFTDAEQSKLAGIEVGATADQSAAEILAALVTVDGAGSGLDADLLDGNQATAFATAAHTHTLADVTDSGALAALDQVTASEIGAKAVGTAAIASGAITTDLLADGNVTIGKLADVASATIRGRATAGVGAVEDLTPAEARGVLGVRAIYILSGRFTTSATAIGTTSATVNWNAVDHNQASWGNSAGEFTVPPVLVGGLIKLNVTMGAIDTSGSSTARTRLVVDIEKDAGGLGSWTVVAKSQDYVIRNNTTLDRGGVTIAGFVDSAVAATGDKWRFRVYRGNSFTADLDPLGCSFSIEGYSA